MSPAIAETVFDASFTRMLPNTAIFSALVEFRTFAEMNKGPAKGRGFEWLLVEGANQDECFENARTKARELKIKGAETASLIIIKVTSQWDAEGKLINKRDWNLEGTRMISDIDY